MLSVTQTGLNAVQKELNVLSNNLANASTVGFKRSYSNFGDIFSNDPSSNPKTAVGMGITTQSVVRDTTQGALKSTSKVTDLAIDGQGYFVLSTNLPAEPLVPQIPATIPPFNGQGLNISANKLPPPPPAIIPPFSGNGLPEPSISQNQTTVKLRLFNNDDLVDVTINGAKERLYNSGIPLDDKVYDLTTLNELGLTIDKSGSQLKLEFGNVYTAWSYGYSLDVNGKNIIAETTPPYWQSQLMAGDNRLTPDQYTPTRSPFIQNLPNFETTDNRQAFDWVTAYNAAQKEYVELKNVGYGFVNPSSFTNPNGINGLYDSSSDGFSGRYQYISFGKENEATDHTKQRNIVFQPQDLTNISQLKFDAIRGNNLNGGTTPQNAGEEFGVFYSIDGGTTFKEITTQSPYPTELTTLSNTNTSFDNWYGVTLDIPSEARTSNTIIKFSQEIYSGAASTNLWGISNIDFVPVEPAPSANTAGILNNWQDGSLVGSSKNVYSKTSGTGLSFLDGFSGKTDYISFGGDGLEGERYLKYNSLDLRSKSSISFDIIKGNDSNGGQSPDVGEGLTLEYSIDGNTFTSIDNYSVADSNLNSWNTKTVNLPAEAQTASTIIRFRQALSSGANYDHWGLANITFNDADVSEPSTSAAITGTIKNWMSGTLNGTSRNVFQTVKGSASTTNDGFGVKDSYIVFGTDGDAGERNLTYNSVDLSLKDSITFDLIRGNGSNGGDYPNGSPEGLSILYSIDNGLTLKNLRTFGYDDQSLDNWSSQSITLPAEAKTKTTRIKFQQPQSSGAPYDHWGLSNIAFTDTPPKAEIVPQLVYSRAGNFGVDKDGYVVNPSGFKLMGTDIKTGKANKAVRIPSADPVSNQPLQAVSINNKGIVSATYGGGPSVDLYRISIATFASDAGLKPLGNVAFAQTGASGTAKISNAGEKGGGNIMAGTLEQANVDITNELMAMIAAQQIYNGNTRMLQTQIEALKRLTDNL
ncbi:MAG: flagellar hook-basal body complex protein [Alphaproteobacteria bacterium]